MKKSILGTLAISAFISLLALAGCDTPVSGGDDNWLAGTANPFIGTWKTSSTDMDDVETITEREFKTDGTIAVKTTTGGGEPSPSTAYYLVKDNVLVLSTTSDPFYTKHSFEVIDNNTIKLGQDGEGEGTIVYNRSGDENPDADRNITLSKGLNAAYRATTPSGMAHYVDGDNNDTVEGEPLNNMYNWYLFSANGTFRYDHYMNKNPHYIDRGKYSYYIDGLSHLVELSPNGTVTVYYDFTPNNTTAAPDTFTWKKTANGEAVSYSKFDGEDFWHSED